MATMLQMAIMFSFRLAKYKHHNMKSADLLWQIGALRVSGKDGFQSLGFFQLWASFWGLFTIQKRLFCVELLIAMAVVPITYHCDTRWLKKGEAEMVTLN